MIFDVEGIERRARHVKIISGDDELLVDDGQITDGYIDIPLRRKKSSGSWLKINVESNKLGGPAVVLIKDNLDSAYSFMNPGRLESFDKGHSYNWGRIGKPAFKAV